MSARGFLPAISFADGKKFNTYTHDVLRTLSNGSIRNAPPPADSVTTATNLGFTAQ